MSGLLFACPELFTAGGIQRFNRNLLDAWNDIGTPVVALTLNDQAAPDWAAQRYQNIRFICCGRSKVRWCASLARTLLVQRPERTVCGHFHLIPPVWAMRCLAGAGHPVAMLLHGVEVWDRMTPLKRCASRSCDRVLAVSSFTRDSFLEQTPGFPPEAAFVFPNTISTGIPGCADRPPRPAGQLRLLSVARLAVTERDKGIRVVLDALAELEGGGVEYIVIGDGDDRDALIAYADERSVHVEFPGRLSDEAMWAEYQRADAFALPSRKEGFGIVFLEAGYFGLPVIAAAEKGAKDVVDDGVNGLMVPYGDPVALRDAIRRLRDDPAMAQAMGAAGRQRVSEDGPFGFAAFRERTRRWLSGKR